MGFSSQLRLAFSDPGVVHGSPRVRISTRSPTLHHPSALVPASGGYYLTSAYGAMSLIKNFQEEQAARVLSSEARNTLHQWHRRRTAQRTVPSVDDFQVPTATPAWPWKLKAETTLICSTIIITV